MATPASSKAVQVPMPQVVSEVPALSSDMQRMFAQKGINVSAITAPVVVFHGKVAWEDLCEHQTEDPKTWVSPILCVTSVQQQPDAPQEFRDYKGLLIAQFTTEHAVDQFVTHALTYADTGEYLPLSAWLIQQTTPFLTRFARISTNKTNQFILRAAPIDIRLA